MKVILLLTLCFTIIFAGPVNLRGINYGFQNPDNSCPSYEQVLNDWKQIATYAEAVKIFSLIACDGAHFSLQAIQDGVGLQFFWGMNAGDDFPRELAKMQQLKSMGYSFDHIIGVTVGSEDIYRNDNDATKNNLISAVKQTKAMLQSLGVTNVPVTHTDVYFKQPADLVAEMDVVMFNAFTFWEGSTPQDGLAAMQNHFSYMQTIAQGKTIWLGETGWPTQGDRQAYAVPSVENQQIYLQSFVCWANSANINYFWFEANDEQWKVAQGAIETSFGLHTQDRVPKASFTIDCSQTPYPSGQNTPAIAMGGFTSTPRATTSSSTSSTSSTTSSTFAAPVTTSSSVVVSPSVSESVATSSQDTPVVVPTTSSTGAAVVDVTSATTQSAATTTQSVTTSAIIDGTPAGTTSTTDDVARFQSGAVVLSVSALCLLVTAALVF